MKEGLYFYVVFLILLVGFFMARDTSKDVEHPWRIFAFIATMIAWPVIVVIGLILLLIDEVKRFWRKVKQ